MKLNEEGFELVENGQKTMELRVNDEKRQSINMGDEIIFTNRDKKVLVKVTRLFLASSFELLFRKIGWIKAGWSNENSERKMSDLRKIYSVEDENKWGVVGIAFEIIN